MNKQQDRITAIQKAREFVKRGFLTIDTETTGLDSNDEICDIAVVGSEGETILSTLVRPTCPITPGAMAVHGITEEMVKDAPTFADVWPLLGKLFSNRLVITYNAEFDFRLLRQSWKSSGLASDKIMFSRDCAMCVFAQFYGEYDSRKGSYRWKTLDFAAKMAGYPAWEAHRALGDALAARAVMLWMARQEG